MVRLIDRLMNWTEDGSVIESTKQNISKHTVLESKRFFLLLNNVITKKKVRIIAYFQRCAVQIHFQWNRVKKVENSIFNAISH